MSKVQTQAYDDVNMPNLTNLSLASKATSRTVIMKRNSANFKPANIHLHTFYKTLPFCCVKATTCQLTSGQVFFLPAAW